MNTIHRKRVNGFESMKVEERNTAHFLKCTNIVHKVVAYAVRITQTTLLKPLPVPVRIVNGSQRSKIERISGA